MRSTFTNSSIFKRFFLLLAAAGFFVGCRHHTPEEKMEYVKEEIIDHLELNADQSKKLDFLGNKVLTGVKDWKAQKKGDIQFIIDQMKNDRIDRDQARAKFKAKLELMEKHYNAILNDLSELHGTLNNDQKKQIVEKLEKIQKWHSKSE